MILIFEGIDNVGKDTQIKMMQTYFAKQDTFAHVFHYSGFKNISDDRSRKISEIMYRSMFYNMLDLNRLAVMFNNNHYIFNRSHIGEAVYSPMYRDYDGDYVFDIEKEMLHLEKFWNDIYLILLLDKPENVIKRDDGKSFSTKMLNKESEIRLFERAYHLSNIKNKMKINIDGKDENKVHQLILNFWR